MKYQPYQGYHHKPWVEYGPGYFPARTRTKGDWRYNIGKVDYHHIGHEVKITYQPGGVGKKLWHYGPELCRACQKVHCYWCPCDKPWKRFDRPGKVRWLKARIHRDFRRHTKDAIHRELSGDDGVSHWFIETGSVWGLY